jgi:hypothetical protein
MLEFLIQSFLTLFVVMDPTALVSAFLGMAGTRPRAVRANRQHEQELEQVNSKFEIKCGSIDEFKLGIGWAYTLKDADSQAGLSFKPSDTQAARHISGG